MDINQIQRVKNAMTGVSPESAQNMLLALLLDAYSQGRMDAQYPLDSNNTIQLFVDATR